jgi:ribonucleoside-diphosphate reductase alpha chain
VSTFPNALAEFVYMRTYARWDGEVGRRETWPECVMRVMRFLRQQADHYNPEALTEATWVRLHKAVLAHEVRPSSRLLAMAGPAAELNHITAYNCAYLPIAHWDAFSEVLYILMAGTGVGFSVERQYTSQLAAIRQQQPEHPAYGYTYVIPDTTEGWADALRYGINRWTFGWDIHYDYTKIRPAGARLQTKGGRASGPEPLRGLLDFTRTLLLGAQGRQLTPAECHHLVCKIGDVVVMGGVRRSAEISLSDLSDDAVRDIKQFGYWETAAHLSMANNSAVYTEKPDRATFDREWQALRESGSGERGIFNRQAASLTKPARRAEAVWGTNPCGEIILPGNAHGGSFCNLSEVVARADDTLRSLREKITLATIIGTIQATMTDFNYLRPQWTWHCDDERLLGVSVTGQLDCPAFRQPQTMRLLKFAAQQVNSYYAERLGINASAAITCVKPSGNASQMVDCASGMHPRYAPYYIRRVRVNTTDPLLPFLRDRGATLFPEVGQEAETATTWVVEFPVKAPPGAITRNDQTALEQLEYWLQVKTEYCEHSASCTIYVGEEEWGAVGDWVYQHFDAITGLAFLPRSNHMYQLAPYEEIDAATYERLLAAFPTLDYRELCLYEFDDMTTSSGELACTGDRCEIV